MAEIQITRAPQRQRRNRKITEQAIIDAFETVLLRDGIYQIGINAVAKEAGVDKVLIYRYFGGLPQLATRWAREVALWPTDMDLIGHDLAGFENKTVRERIKTVLIRFMETVRQRPQTAEILAGELMTQSDLTTSLTEVLADSGVGVGEHIQLDRSDRDTLEKVWRLIAVVRTLTSYLVIRQRYNPEYLEMDLRQDQSWDFLLDTVAGMAEAYLASDIRPKGKAFSPPIRED